MKRAEMNELIQPMDGNANYTSRARDRIMLVCFRFGPGCDTGGYRWNAMVRDLTARAWKFDVITVGSLKIEGGGHKLDRLYYNGAVEIFQIPQDWWGERLRDAAGKWRTSVQRLRGETSSSVSFNSNDADTARSEDGLARGWMGSLWSSAERTWTNLSWSEEARRYRHIYKGVTSA